MRSNNEHQESLESSSFRELRLLEKVDTTPDVSQRQLARHLGIALGVANILVRSMAKKGYIKITRLGWRRWAYVLTPAGVARKVNLTLTYIERFVDHYKKVRHLLSEDLKNLTLTPESKVAILGTNELAELAFLVLRDIGVNDIHVYDQQITRSSFLGIKVQLLSTIKDSTYTKVILAMQGDTTVLRRQLGDLGISSSSIVELLHKRKETAIEDRVAPVT